MHGSFTNLFRIRSDSGPKGMLRYAFRLPMYLYRLELGWLFGHRCLMLTHRGRKSDLLRQTVLEVVTYDPVSEESVVVSGWGEKAQWYRNISASPALEVETGRERYVPLQRFLTPQESYAVLAAYEHAHPHAFKMFARLLHKPIDGSEAALRNFTESVRLVAFRPRDIRSPARRHNTSSMTKNC